MRRALRLMTVMALAGAVGGCFQPLYGTASVGDGPGLRERLAAVEVAQIPAPNGTELARVAVETRNQLLFGLTGGSGSISPTHRLNVQLYSRVLTHIVDPTTQRAEFENVNLNATYSLTDLASGKEVARGTVVARVSYNIPGQQQRFIRFSGYRDAENQAAKIIADQLRSRLASFFVAGS
jgi:LPS-assembly lipoprotein